MINLTGFYLLFLKQNLWPFQSCITCTIIVRLVNLFNLYVNLPDKSIQYSIFDMMSNVVLFKDTKNGFVLFNFNNGLCPGSQEVIRRINCRKWRETSGLALPKGHIKNAVCQCTSKIREIAGTAGIIVGSCSSAVVRRSVCLHVFGGKSLIFLQNINLIN